MFFIQWQNFRQDALCFIAEMRTLNDRELSEFGMSKDSMEIFFVAFFIVPSYVLDVQIQVPVFNYVTFRF